MINKQPSPLIHIIILVSILLCAFAAPVPAAAQENGGIETFDDASLPGWEHSQNVRVLEGTLRIDPDNVAFKMGSWTSPTITVQFKLTPPGSLTIHFHASEQGAYHLNIFSEGEMAEMFLQKDNEGTMTELGGTIVEGFKADDWNTVTIQFKDGTHQVSINETDTLNAEDESPLPSGGIGFMAHGGSAIQLDNLQISSEGGEIHEPDPAGEEPAAQDGAEEDPPQMEPGMEEPGEMHEEPGQGEPSEAGLPPASIQTTPQVVPEPGTGTRSLLEEFLISGTNPIDLPTYTLNLGLAALLSFILSRIYIYWGASLSNRRKFAANFMLLTVTTTFIILVVRSSVALSLGLVGALSIVRFRAAIKEPEELAYLFLAIGLGIGLGDNQRLITILAFTASVAVLGLMNLLRHSKADINMHLTISSNSGEKPGLDRILKVMEPHCSKCKLVRFEEHDSLLEISFIIELIRIEDLSDARSALKDLLPSASITFLDNKGIW